MKLKGAFGVKGYDQLDVVEARSKSRGFEYQSGEGYRLTHSDEFGLGVRAVVKGKVGHAYANRYEDLKTAAKNAIKAAKYSNIKFELKNYSKYRSPRNTRDKILMQRSNSDFLDLLKKVRRLAKNKKCSVLEAGVGAEETSVRYANSEGVDASDKSTAFGLSWDLSDKKESCSYSIEDTRFVNKISKKVSRTCELAKLQEKGQNVKTASMPVVFHHYAFPAVLAYGLAPAFSAENVQQGKSKLAGKLGKKVFSKKLSITDNGRLASGLGSGKFDAEGVPSQKTPLVKKGVLKGFLYDLARANKAGTESTANGSRSYSSPASIAPTNFVVKKSGKDVVSRVDRGILVYSALNAHSIDYISGDFSIGASHAFVIKNGELVGSPKKIMLSGNIYDLLSDVKAVGSDQVQQSTHFGNVVTPSVLSECLVVGE